MFENPNVPVDSHYKRVILLHLYERWQTQTDTDSELYGCVDASTLMRKYDEKTNLGLQDMVRNVRDLIERGYVTDKGNPEKVKPGISWEFVCITAEGRKLIETSKLDLEFPARWRKFPKGRSL